MCFVTSKRYKNNNCAREIHINVLVKKDLKTRKKRIDANIIIKMIKRFLIPQSVINSVIKRNPN